MCFWNNILSLKLLKLHSPNTIIILTHNYLNHREFEGGDISRWKHIFIKKTLCFRMAKMHAFFKFAPFSLDDI